MDYSQGAYWMGSSHSSVYIRPVYSMFWEITTGADNWWVLPTLAKLFSSST